MLNIANEWGSNALDKNGYKVAYVQAIRKLREAGYRIPLVIDTGGWGQNITYLTAALDGTKKPTWQHLIETDHTLTGQANLMFGLHLYGDWHMKRGEQGAKYGLFDDLIPLSKIAPLLVGEFGWASKDNPDNAKMTVAAIIKEIYLHNLHANVYSWGGNNPYFRTPGKVGPLRNYSYLDFVPSAYTYGPNLPDGPQVQKYTFKNNELTSFGKQLITKENKLAIARPKARFSPAP